MTDYLDSLVKFLMLSSPSLLVGLLVAGWIRQILNVDKVKNVISKKNKMSVFWASLLGLPLPLCSCSVIPSAITLKKSGINNGTTTSFLISTPESGMDSVFMTYSIMDLPMTIFRPVCAFITAWVAGLSQIFFKTDDDKDIEKVKEDSCCSSSSSEDTSKVGNFFVEGFKFSFGKLIDDLSFWLLVGILLGALVDVIVPDQFFSGLNSHMSRVIIVLVGIPLYICASASTPVAASLVIKGLSPGTALLFLLVGPATNVSNLVVLQKYLGKRAIIINIVVIVIVGLIASYLVDFIYSYYQWNINFKISSYQKHDHVGYKEYIAMGSSVVLVLLLMKGIWFEEIVPRLKRS